MSPRTKARENLDDEVLMTDQDQLDDQLSLALDLLDFAVVTFDEAHECGDDGRRTELLDAAVDDLVRARAMIADVHWRVSEKVSGADRAHAANGAGKKAVTSPPESDAHEADLPEGPTACRVRIADMMARCGRIAQVVAGIDGDEPGVQGLRRAALQGGTFLVDVARELLETQESDHTEREPWGEVAPLVWPRAMTAIERGLDAMVAVARPAAFVEDVVLARQLCDDVATIMELSASIVDTVAAYEAGTPPPKRPTVPVSLRARALYWCQLASVGDEVDADMAAR